MTAAARRGLPMMTATPCASCSAAATGSGSPAITIPSRPTGIGGTFADALAFGALTFRHVPSGEAGEIAGHLHPVARISQRGRTVSRRCFAADEMRMVMPAFGAFTGGLNVRDRGICAREICAHSGVGVSIIRPYAAADRSARSMQRSARCLVALALRNRRATPIAPLH